MKPAPTLLGRLLPLLAGGVMASGCAPAARPEPITPSSTHSTIASPARLGVAVPGSAIDDVAAAKAEPAGNVRTRRGLTLSGARAVVAAALAEARRKGTTGVVAVVDDGGQVVALERIDGTFPAGARISIGKARTAALFKKPTRVFEEIIAKGRTPMVALEDFTPLVGGIPLVVDGEIVGAVGVSGAASADQDEELAKAGARGLGETTTSSRLREVTVYANDRVVAAFAKGTPLVENDEYKIHASRRDGPGKVEVHAKDTDILYVLEGSATVVTGGTVIGAETIEADEVRGRAIEGGQARTVVKGDVLVIPRGIPHWFRDVPGPLTYYTVKTH